jgi:Mce-associated membrane protein
MSPDADPDATRPFIRASAATAPQDAQPGVGPSGKGRGPAEEPTRPSATPPDPSTERQGPSAGPPAPSPEVDAGVAAAALPADPAPGAAAGAGVEWPPGEIPAGASPRLEAPAGAAEPGLPGRPGVLARLPQGRRLAALAGGAALGAGLVAALIVAEVNLAHANAVDRARTAAMAAAESFAVDISSYDYRHLDQDFKRVTDRATGKLKSDFTTASRSLAPLLVRVKGTATGTVVAAGVADATPDRATVVVLLDQTVSNSTAPAPRLDRSRLVMTVTHGSGGWLVDSVQPR